MSNHLVIKDGACGEIVVKKSRFIAELKYVETEEEATTFIKEKKKQYHDARHNCSCYIIGEELKKSSDDGEPSGTAGRPMLEVLEGKDLINVVAVVTRYFGGVLLGTGGLVRAYQDAVKEALLNCDFLHTVVVNKVNVTLDYSIWPKIENYCKEKGVVVGEVEFAENVKAKLKIRVDNTDKVIDDIIEITNGKGHIDKDDKEYTIFCD
ncbi:MAG: YigZ family protein [Lachnospiraceae bacterium]|nr:YigZ family protein [Lachnospiraceae bacterium]